MIFDFDDKISNGLESDCVSLEMLLFSMVACQNFAIVNRTESSLGSPKDALAFK